MRLRNHRAALSIDHTRASLGAIADGLARSEIPTGHDVPVQVDKANAETAQAAAAVLGGARRWHLYPVSWVVVGVGAWAFAAGLSIVGVWDWLAVALGVVLGFACGPGSARIYTRLRHRLGRRRHRQAGSVWVPVTDDGRAAYYDAFACLTAARDTVRRSGLGKVPVPTERWWATGRLDLVLAQAWFHLSASWFVADGRTLVEADLPAEVDDDGEAREVGQRLVDEAASMELLLTELGTSWGRHPETAVAGVCIVNAQTRLTQCGQRLGGVWPKHPRPPGWQAVASLAGLALGLALSVWAWWGMPVAVAAAGIAASSNVFADVCLLWAKALTLPPLSRALRNRTVDDRILRVREQADALGRELDAHVDALDAVLVRIRPNEDDEDPPAWVSPTMSVIVAVRSWLAVADPIIRAQADAIYAGEVAP